MKIIEVLKMVKPEEIVFGTLTIFTVSMNETSGIPGMICLLLLAFYYLIFSWYIFPISEEKHLIFSILAGLVYAVCLVCLAVYSVKIYDGYFLLYLEGLLLLCMIFYLIPRRGWKIYRNLHFFRAIVIALLNVYLYVFHFN
ncbi:hypothetical protein N824_13320 [Pedobacter sp. V48]|nr:hypothetical protein N824_13320 [Pedobacter sp. V48]